MLNPAYLNEVKDLVNEHLSRIASPRPTKLHQMEDYATGFLTIRGILVDFRAECEKEKAKLEVMVNVTFRDAYNNSSATNQPQKKIDASADPDFMKFSTQLKEYSIESDWARSFMDIFDNAHVTYRQMMRD